MADYGNGTEQAPAGSFGRGFGRGFGKSRGAGRAANGYPDTSEPPVSNGFGEKRFENSGGSSFGARSGFGNGRNDSGSSASTNGFGNRGSRGGFGSRDDEDNSSRGFGGRGGGFGGGRGGGFGGSRGGGFGGSRGGGFGNRHNDDNEDNGNGGFGSRGGFSSRGRGGFGDRNSDDNEDRGSGFGSGRGGFSTRGRGGFSSKNDNEDSGSRGFGNRGSFGSHRGGFGTRNSDNEESSGGFGGSGGFGSSRGREGFGRRNDDETEDRSGFGRDGGRGGRGFGSRSGYGRNGDDESGGGFRRGFGSPDDESGGGFGRRGGGRGGGFGRSDDHARGGGFGRSGGENSDSFGGGNDGEEKKREIYVPPPPPEEEEEIFQTIQKGINFDKYDEIAVKVSGDDPIPNSINSFDQADITDTLKENVRKAGYEKPTPIQKHAIPIITAGRDIMGCAQTGSGKTAAFLLPVLSRILEENLMDGCGAHEEVQRPACLIVGPTRELVNQIHLEARKFSYHTPVRAVVVYGGTSVGSQLREVERGCNIVAGTPGRLIDFIQRGKISLEKLKVLILDEADQMLDQGFEPEIRRIQGLGLPKERQTLMFSATFEESIQKLARDFLRNYLFVAVGRLGGANTDITQQVYNVGKYEKREKLVEILKESVHSGEDKTLIFAKTKRDTDFLACFLSQQEFKSTSIHGDRFQREREEALRDFKAGVAPILVATSVAARGLDIPGVRHVINYDLPDNIQEYVHRIGRTGRCGNTGRATSFFDTNGDASLARELISVLGDAQQEVPSWLEECAEGSLGGGFSGGGGFGGRDIRRGRGGGGGFNQGSGFDNGGGSGFGGAASTTAAADDEDNWE